MEPDHNSTAAETRLQRQVHLGNVSPLVRQADWRLFSAGHRRRADRPILGNGALWAEVDIGYVKATGKSVKIYLPKTRFKTWSRLNGRFRSGATRLSGIGHAPTFRPTPQRPRCISPNKR